MRQTDFFMKAKDPKALTVEQLMQDAVTRCTSCTDASTIAPLMTHRNFGSLPVVEEDGTLVGIVRSVVRDVSLVNRAPDCKAAFKTRTL